MNLVRKTRGHRESILVLFTFLHSIPTIILGFSIQTLGSKLSPLVDKENRGVDPVQGLSLSFEQRKIQHKSRRTLMYSKDPSTASSRNEDTVSGDREELSDLDARVLRSILESGDLDLTTEDNMKKLLDRGTIKSTKTESNTEVKNTDSEFKSDFLQTFANNEFWNSLRTKADAVIESTKIFVQNRLERDAQLLASIGLFAWQRALKDAGRALPSAGRSGAGMAETMRRALFQLSSNSSFVQYIPDDNFILPPSKYSNVETFSDDPYNELNTPMDEIKSVTDSIKAILSGKTPATTNDRSLRSVAPAGRNQNRVRQKRAYLRKKETTLKREKEGVDVKLGRAASSVTDSVWQMKREMEIEGNTPGYRSKEVRQRIEGSFSNVGLLGGDTAKRMFGSVKGDNEKDSDVFILGGDKSFPMPDFDDSAYEIQERREIVFDDLLDEWERLALDLQDCIERPDQTWLYGDIQQAQEQDNLFFADEKDYDESWDRTITTMIFTRDGFEARAQNNNETEYANEEAILTEVLEMKSVVNSIVSLSAVSAGVDAAEKLRQVLLGTEEENMTLLASIDQIIEDKKSWESEKSLIEERKKKAFEVWEAEKARLVEDRVTLEEMVKTEEDRRILEMKEKEKCISAAGEPGDLSKEGIPPEDKVEKKNVKTIRGDEPFLGNNIMDFFERRQVEEMEKERELETNYSENVEFLQNEKLDGSNDELRNAIVPEVLDADMYYVPMEKEVAPLNSRGLAAEVDVEVTRTSLPSENAVVDTSNDDCDAYYNVEVVTMEDDIDMNSAIIDESEIEEETENPLILLTLRTLDVIFFVVEKGLTVGLPGFLIAFKMAKSRNEEIQRSGLGKNGWDLLENTSSGLKKY